MQFRREIARHHFRFGQPVVQIHFRERDNILRLILDGEDIPTSFFLLYFFFKTDRGKSDHRDWSGLPALKEGGLGLRSPHSTVTLFAKFLGWSTSVPFTQATWYASNCTGTA